MSAKLKLYEVTHPELGKVVVNGTRKENAIKTALEGWGANFRQEAGYCDAREIGTAAKPRCRRCHSEFGEPGDTTAYCRSCQEIIDRERREAARFRRRDRRREEA